MMSCQGYFSSMFLFRIARMLEDAAQSVALVMSPLLLLLLVAPLSHAEEEVIKRGLINRSH